MKRVTTNPSKRSRQERALKLAEDRVAHWKWMIDRHGPDFPAYEDDRYENAPNLKQKLDRAETDVKNLRAKGVTLPVQEDE